MEILIIVLLIIAIILLVVLLAKKNKLDGEISGRYPMNLGNQGEQCRNRPVKTMLLHKVREYW